MLSVKATLVSPSIEISATIVQRKERLWNVGRTYDYHHRSKYQLSRLFVRSQAEGRAHIDQVTQLQMTSDTGSLGGNTLHQATVTVEDCQTAQLRAIVISRVSSP